MILNFKDLLILLFLELILYFHILHAPFLFDDQLVIINNSLIQSLSHGWQGLGRFGNLNIPIITNLSFAFDFYFYHLNTFGYHLTNLIIHFLTVIGVWFFTKTILDFKDGGKIEINLPFWAAILFLVHPLNTESVSYISQRPSSLVALFLYLVGHSLCS